MTWGDTFSGVVDSVKSVGTAVGEMKGYFTGAKEQPSYMGKGNMPGFGSDGSYGGSSGSGFQSSNSGFQGNSFQPRNKPWETKKTSSWDSDWGKKKSKKKKGKKKKKARDLDDFFDSSSDSEEEVRKKKKKKKKQRKLSIESDSSEPSELVRKKSKKKKKKREQAKDPAKRKMLNDAYFDKLKLKHRSPTDADSADSDDESEEPKPKRRSRKSRRKKSESSDSEDERKKRRKPKPSKHSTKKKPKRPTRPTKQEKQLSDSDDESDMSDSSDLDELLVDTAPKKSKSKKKSKKIPAKPSKASKRPKLITKKLDVQDDDSDIDELFEDDKKSKKKKSKKKSKKAHDSPVITTKPEDVPDLLDLKALAKKSDPASILDDLGKPSQPPPTDDIFSITKTNDNLLRTPLTGGLATVTQPNILSGPQPASHATNNSLFTQLHTQQPNFSQPQIAMRPAYPPVGNAYQPGVYPQGGAYQQQMGLQQQGYYPYAQQRPQMQATQSNRSPFPTLQQQPKGKKKTTKSLAFKDVMSAENFSLGKDPNPAPSLSSLI